jgi:hypothetical protein
MKTIISKTESFGQNLLKIYSASIYKNAKCSPVLLSIWTSLPASTKWKCRGKNGKDKRINFLIGIVGGGVHLGPLGTAATNRPIVPAPGDYNEGEIGGMIGRGNRRTRRKPAPVPLCSYKPHMLCPDENPGRRGGKSATNRLSYGKAKTKDTPRGQKTSGKLHGFEYK